MSEATNLGQTPGHEPAPTAGEAQAALEAVPFGRVAGESVSLATALRELKRDLSGAPLPAAEWPRRVVERLVVARAAEAAGLAPTEAERGEGMVRFRTERGLYAAAETEAFLAARGLSAEEFVVALDHLWAERALRGRHAESRVEQTFLQRVTEFDRALLSELVVPGEELARELALQVREEEIEFRRLVRQHSTAPSREAGGFLGEVRRGALRGREAAAVFAAEPDEVVGPFPHAREFRILQVHAVRRAELTEALRAEIAEELWQEWLARQVAAAEAEVTLLRLL